MTLLKFIKLVSMCKGAMSIHLMQSFESGHCYDYVKMHCVYADLALLFVTLYTF